MTEHAVSGDTQVSLMLTAKLGQSEDGSELLRPSEYVALVRWLKEQSVNLEALLEEPDLVSDETVEGLSHERLQNLLGRGVALAMSLERWAAAGIWALGWTDEQYPERYKERLKANAPPILFGTGDPSLLSQGGVCVVGSRKLDEPAVAFTERVGELCARHKTQVISGGAKGADAGAMYSCLQHGGSVVGVLAEGLARAAVAPDTREWLREGSLTLISPFDPGAHFLVYNAMGRNKLLYTLSDWSLVVSSAYNEGGTWSGAKENLSKKWVPLFVRTGPDVPDGNAQLIKMGAIALDESLLDSDFDLPGWLEENAGGTEVDQLSMF